MSQHLSVNLRVNRGDVITAIGEAVDIAKLRKENLYLECNDGINLRIMPTSEVQDLITIWQLEVKVKKLEKKIENPA